MLLKTDVEDLLAGVLRLLSDRTRLVVETKSVTLPSLGHTRQLHLIHTPEDRPNLDLTRHSSNNYHTSSVAISAQGLRVEVRGIFFPPLPLPGFLGRTCIRR